MAKKKKRRRGGGRKKRSAPKKKAKPVGLAGGAALGVMDFATVPAAGSTVAARTVKLLKGEATLEATIAAIQEAATTPSVYKYPVIGLLVTASPRIPIIGLVARPADRGLKRLTKGKWGL